jgi:hypothetical protein
MLRNDPVHEQRDPSFNVLPTFDEYPFDLNQTTTKSPIHIIER